MYDKCYFCLDQLPKLKKESTASFFVNFGGAGVQKSRPTLLYKKLCSNVSSSCRALQAGAVVVGEILPDIQLSPCHPPNVLMKTFLTTTRGL